MKDPWDIAWHTIPTVLVCIGMGFMTAYGLHHIGNAFGIFLAVAGTAAGLGFCLLWRSREMDQHGGRLGSAQSKLEAWVPLIAGPTTFVASTAAFWLFPI